MSINQIFKGGIILCALFLIGCYTIDSDKGHSSLLENIYIDVIDEILKPESLNESHDITSKYYVVEKLSKITEIEKMRLVKAGAINYVDQNLTRINVIDLNENTDSNLEIVNEKIDFNITKAKGIISFSIPLLDKDNLSGVFVFKFLCGGECGHEKFIFFKKKNEKFIIERMIIDKVY